MNSETLSNICDVKNGYAFKSSDYLEFGYRVIRITNVQKGIVVDNNPKFISEEIANKLPLYKLMVGDILVSLTGNVGRVGIIEEKHLPAVLNQRVGLIRPISDRIHDKYLFQYLNSSVFEKEAIKNSNGAAQKNLSSKWIDKHKIPLPALSDQYKIAYLLDEISKLIIKRKEQILEADKLLKSIFFDIFGDPVRNEKGWVKKTLGNILIGVDSGWSPKCESFSSKDNEWGILKLGAVSLGEFKPNENKAMLPGSEPKTQHEVKAGDLLFVRKNTYELVAATAYVNDTRPKLLMPDLIFRLVVKNKSEVDPIYLWRLLSYPSQRKSIQSLASGAAGSMPNISKAKLKTAEIPVPDIEIQRKFIDIVNKVESIKISYLSSLKDLENLYGSISQKAFNGELDISKVPLQELVGSENIVSNASNDVSKEVHAKRDPTVSEAVFSKESLILLLVNYIQELDGKYFSLDDYWQRYGEIDQENDEIIGVDDYEVLKEHIFTLISRGELEQVFDKEKKQLLLRTPA
jgi:type I restriction enzyme S subunit